MLADQQHDVSAVNLCKWGLEELEVQHPASRISHLASEKLQMTSGILGRIEFH